MLCTISNLNQEHLDAIRQLEKELGKTLLAFSCHDIQTSQINASELKKIQDLENKLSLSLVAVES